MWSELVQYSKEYHKSLIKWLNTKLKSIVHSIRGLHGLKTEARTRPVPEIVWPNPTRPERHG